MEKKTNKAKLEILKIFEKISFPQNWRQLCLTCKFYKNMLIRVFLHAEFISAMKTIQIPRIFVKNAKE